MGEGGTGGCSPGWGQGPGFSLRGAGTPVPERWAVTGTHALLSTGSVHEGTVVALLGYSTPKCHQPTTAVGCS